MTRMFIASPLHATVESLIDGMEAQGVDLATLRVWQGPDGLWRGSGEITVDAWKRSRDDASAAERTGTMTTAEIDALRLRVATLTRERDEWIIKCSYAYRRGDEALADLREFGRHSAGCSAECGGQYRCRCGWREVAARLGIPDAPGAP